MIEIVSTTIMKTLGKCQQEKREDIGKVVSQENPKKESNILKSPGK